MWLSLVFISGPLAVLLVWGARLLWMAHCSSRRIKRMNQLEGIICSTQYTSEQRRAAMDELLDMSQRTK